MTGNASFRLVNTTVLSVCAVDAPVVMASAAFDERLADTYRRVGMRPGMLEKLAGVVERRWWPVDVSFADAAAMAGAKALAEAGITPAQVGVLINTAVSREYLEPSTAVAIHHQMGLPTNCLNFDLANACLGFVNGIQLAGTMIDSGQADYAVIVDAEGSRYTQEVTLERLAAAEATAADLRSQFATLTLGSGSAAMVLGRADRHPEGHRVVGGVSRAGTEHHDLCVGDLTRMRTDSKRLFEAGLALALATWADAKEEFEWDGIDWFVAHQTSVVHIRAMADALGVDPTRFPLTVPTYGNMGPAAVPFTLALHMDQLRAEDRILLLGIGSGLNTSYAEIVWCATVCSPRPASQRSAECPESTRPGPDWYKPTTPMGYREPGTCSTTASCHSRGPCSAYTAIPHGPICGAGFCPARTRAGESWRLTSSEWVTPSGSTRLALLPPGSMTSTPSRRNWKSPGKWCWQRMTGADPSRSAGRSATLIRSPG
jgi:acyl-CoA:acyl-CoA alkyltransferase